MNTKRTKKKKKNTMAMIVASVNINVWIVIDGGKVQTHGEVLHKNVIIVAMEYMLTNRHVYNQENLI